MQHVYAVHLLRRQRFSPYHKSKSEEGLSHGFRSCCRWFRLDPVQLAVPVMQDGKLLKEYNIKDGDTINLMVKPEHPGIRILHLRQQLHPLLLHPCRPRLIPTPLDLGRSILAPVLKREASKDSECFFVAVTVERHSGRGGEGHHVDHRPGVLPSRVAQNESLSTYHRTVANPEFWGKLYAFLRFVSYCHYLG